MYKTAFFTSPLQLLNKYSIKQSFFYNSSVKQVFKCYFNLLVNIPHTEKKFSTRSFLVHIKKSEPNN